MRITDSSLLVSNADARQKGIKDFKQFYHHTFKGLLESGCVFMSSLLGGQESKSENVCLCVYAEGQLEE